MEPVSLDGCSFESAGILILSNGSGKPSRRGGRESSRKHEQTIRKSGNRVLMLGRLRELALYRAEVLSHHGFDVITPSNESEAIEAIRQANFDIAIVSYTLSDISVRQFVDLIRQHCPHSPVLAISQSAYSDRLIEPDSVVIGDKGPGELVTALRKLLQRP